MRGAQEILNSYWCPVIIGDACNQYDKKSPAFKVETIETLMEPNLFKDYTCSVSISSS